MKYFCLLLCIIVTGCALSACDTIAAGLAQVAGTALVGLW